MNPLLLSIIIPTKDRMASLKTCLRSVEQALTHLQKAYPDDILRAECIICDDSTDDTLEPFIRECFPSFLYLKGPQKGPAANRNAGVALSQGEWLVFIDDDCVARPDWLIEFYKHFPGNRALEGCILPIGPLKDLWKCPVNTAGGNFWSANIAIRRDAFLDLGGFDSFFPYPAYEDSDLYWRLKKQNTIPFIKNAIVEHPVMHSTIQEALKKDFRTLESRAYLLAKHSKNEGLISCLNLFVREYYLYLKEAFGCLYKGLWKSSLLNFTAAFFFVPCLMRFFLKYRKLWKNP